MGIKTRRLKAKPHVLAKLNHARHLLENRPVKGRQAVGAGDGGEEGNGGREQGQRSHAKRQGVHAAERPRWGSRGQRLGQAPGTTTEPQRGDSDWDNPLCSQRNAKAARSLISTAPLEQLPGALVRLRRQCRRWTP